TVAKEARVKVLHIREHRPGSHIRRIFHLFAWHSRFQQLFFRKEADGFHSPAQILPEGFDASGSREASCHAHHRDILSLAAFLRLLTTLEKLILLNLLFFHRQKRWLQQLDQGADSGSLKESNCWQLHMQGLLQLAQNLQANQRVAAQVEEVIIQADLFNAE